MPLTMNHEEYMALQKQLQAHFDGRYVRTESCESHTSNFANQLNRDNVRLTVIEQGQKINNWLTLGIAGGIVALVIKVFLGG